MKKFYCLHNKKGSLAVLLAMVFVCLIMVVTVFIKVSAEAAEYSYCDSVLQLAGRSVLSEYHVALKDSYGLIAYKGYDSQVSEKLKFYGESSFKHKRSGAMSGSRKAVSPLKPKIKSLRCRLDSFALAEPDIFEEQLIDYMKYPVLVTKKIPQYVYDGQAVLKNQRMINMLPSKGIEENGFNISEIAEQAKTFLNGDFSVVNAVIADKYIEKKFNCRMQQTAPLKTFFRNEREYILYGKFSDEENANAFVRDLRALRMILNSFTIWTDSIKRNEVLMAAEVMTPGPEAAITAVALGEMWAAAETGNDINLLLAGKNAAMMKGQRQWALTLKSVMSGTNGKGYVVPPDTKGSSYSDYLALFLHFQDRERKLLRMMDLIQINLQGNFDEDFYLKDCYTGLKYEAQINSQRYIYVQNY